MRMLRLTITAFFFSILLHLNAQESLVPHFMTPAEEKILADYIRQKHKDALRSIPAPPPGQVRTMAEWEEIQALIITWAGQSTILKEIVRHAVKECKVMIITNDSTNVITQLTNALIPLDSVRFIDTPFNSIWVRDYGPWSVYNNDVDSLWIVDWIYNRPRPKDDATPVAIADYLDIPIYEATAAPLDWVHTGGNHLPDGMGTVFSSMLVLDENPDKTEAQIDSIANLFLGVNQYIKFPTLPYDGIHHLDMHMRVIDEETIFFGQYPEGVSDGPQIESNIQYLQDEFTTAFGHPYTILRLPMPPDQSGRYPSQGGNYRTYTNSIFINKTILVPTYEEKYDTTALRIYRENLPGYNVVGINCNAIIPSLGALHCITKTVGNSEPLWIAHSRLRDTDNVSSEYPVLATIKHISGIESAGLFYRISPDSLYTSVPMVMVDSASNTWAGLIPPQTVGSEIQYYIHAVANNGKQQVRPIVAPEGYFKFHILGELPNQPPLVNITQPLDGSHFSIDDHTISITFEVSDIDGVIDHANLNINGEGVFTFDTLPYTYEWSIPSEGEYYIVAEATDDDGAVSTSDTVHITIEETTSAGPVSDNSEIIIYPNPVEDVLWIKRDEITNDDFSVEVFNSLGQQISVSITTIEKNIEVDFSSAPVGIYFIQIEVMDKILAYRVIKN